MAKRTRMQLHTSEHGDADSNGVQDTGSTPVASTTPFQPQVFENKTCGFCFHEPQYKLQYIITAFRNNVLQAIAAYCRYKETLFLR